MSELKISAPHEPKPAPYRKGRGRGELGDAIVGIEAGKAITVSGMLYATVASTLFYTKKNLPGRVYSLNKMEDGTLQITRKA